MLISADLAAARTARTCAATVSRHCFRRFFGFAMSWPTSKCVKGSFPQPNVDQPPDRFRKCRPIGFVLAHLSTALATTGPHVPYCAEHVEPMAFDVDQTFLELIGQNVVAMPLKNTKVIRFGGALK
jgi:hypothetical protein